MQYVVAIIKDGKRLVFGPFPSRRAGYEWGKEFCGRGWSFEIFMLRSPEKFVMVKGGKDGRFHA